MLMKSSMALSVYWFVSWPSRYWLVFIKIRQREIHLFRLSFFISVLAEKYICPVKISVRNCFRIQF